MRSRDVVSGIKEIYDHYQVIPNLREHMLRAASVGLFICEHWKGPRISKADIVACLLVHDIGNTVKLDLETEHGLKLLGNSGVDIEAIRKIRERMVSEYGSDDHKANIRMANEIGVSSRLIQMIEGYRFLKLEDVLNGSDWGLKIFVYCDMRAGPFGIVSLTDRIADIKMRYGHRDSSVNRKDAGKYFDCMFKIERQVAANAQLKPEDINDDSVPILTEEAFQDRHIS